MTVHAYERPRPPLPKLLRRPPRRPQSDDPDHEDQTYVFDLTAVDPTGKPIVGVELSIVNNNTGVTSSRYTDGNGFANHAIVGRPDDLITYTTNGGKIVASTHAPAEGPPYVYLPSGDPHVSAQLALDSFKQGYRPSPVLARGPLLPFPQPVNYYTTLPWAPVPALPTRDWLRGDFWGVVMEGAPIPDRGVSTRHPERIMSWFLDRYSEDFQKAYLEKVDGYGYTHHLLSYADSTAAKDQPMDKPPGAGRNLDQFIETCLLVKRYVRYCHVRFGSKYFQPSGMTAQQWADFVDPVFEALVKAKAVDEVSLGWELNLWNTPGKPLIDALRHLGQQAHAAGLSSWQHFSPHYTSWFADGDGRGRFGWYDDLAGDVDGIDYQTMGANWSPQMLQARIVDTLWDFGQRDAAAGRVVYKFRMEEDLAVWMWDNDSVLVQVDDAVDANGHPVLTEVSVTPEDSNLRGYLSCCTFDDVKHTGALVWGFGNGGRRPDGSRL